MPTSSSLERGGNERNEEIEQQSQEILNEVLKKECCSRTGTMGKRMPISAGPCSSPYWNTIVCNGVGMTQLIRFHHEEDKKTLSPK